MNRSVPYFLRVRLILVSIFFLSGNNYAFQEAERLDGANVKDLDVHTEVQTEINHIQLSFVVRDERGNMIRDLTEDDFVILENGVPQEIAVVREADVPVSVVVMIDTSWSIGSFLENVVETGTSFFKHLSGERSAFVLFSETASVLIPWDEESYDLDRLKELEINGRTALYDSVIWTTNTLFDGVTGKKLIILISDGIDTESKADFEKMMEITRERGVTLYSVIYSNEILERFRAMRDLKAYPRKISSDFLKFVQLQNRFVDRSMRYGGRTIFSNKFSDLKRIYADIVQEMKSHYLILYKSDNNIDISGDERSVTVHTRKIPGKIFIEISQ